MVKADTATVCVPELELEIPPATQRGSITTVEGLLREAAAALRQLQPERAAEAPATAAALDTFLARLDACASADMPFTVELDDPAGNSYVESPHGGYSATGLLACRWVHLMWSGRLASNFCSFV